MSQKVKDKFMSKMNGEPAVQSFIKKTFDILEEQKYSDIVCWSEDGTSILIKNPTEFAQKVLPIYFKHNNLTSFVRQLNMYNFRKKKSKSGQQMYTHELFQRGRRHLLKEIQRKNAENAISSLEKSLAGIEATKSNDDPVAVNHESITNQNLLLRKLNREALSKINSLEDKIKDVNGQNQTLWKKIHEKQEKMDLLKFSFINFLQENGIKETNIPIDLRNELHQQDIHLENERIFEPPQNYSTDHFFSDFVPNKSVDTRKADPCIMTRNYSSQQQISTDVIHSNPFELRPMDSPRHGSLDEEQRDIFDPKRSEFEKFYPNNASDTTHGSCSGTTIGDDEELKV